MNCAAASKSVALSEKAAEKIQKISQNFQKIKSDFLLFLLLVNTSPDECEINVK